MSIFTNPLKVLKNIFQPAYEFAKPFLAQLDPVLREAAMAGVNAAEGQGGTGSEKFDLARKAIERILKSKGRPIVENLINGAIELAVARLKAAL